MGELTGGNMGDISLHFNRSEFSCKCGCGFNVVDVELIKLLELVRNRWGVAVTINSAARCYTHNNNVGGSKFSQHLLGKAADIKVRGVAPVNVYNFLNVFFRDQYGLGNYDTFTHIDVRDFKARF